MKSQKTINGKRVFSRLNSSIKLKLLINKRNILFIPLAFSIAISLIVIGLRQARLFENLELKAFDKFLQLCPGEMPDKRIILVGISEKDIRSAGQYPISDQLLAALLQEIKAQNPRVIGLDLVRDLPVQPGQEKLFNLFKATPNLIGTGLVAEGTEAIAFPPILLAKGQVGDMAGIVDADGVVRRGFLYPRPDLTPTIPSLSLKLAEVYLAQENISFTHSQENPAWLKIGKTSFPTFETNDGGYMRADAGGYQIPINWRNHPEPFRQVFLSDVLEKKIPPNLFHNRIVLIGVVAKSEKDVFTTPISFSDGMAPLETYGVEIHAHLLSQILSAALDGRRLIRTWTERGEWAWIIAWIGLSGLLLYRPHLTPLRLVLTQLGGVIGLSLLAVGIHWGLFLQGWWLPIVPTVVGVWGTAVVIFIFILNQQHIEALKRENQRLKEKETLVRRLATELACELNNPILQLRLVAQTLELESQKKLLLDSLFLSQTLHILKENVDRLSHITRLMIPVIESKITYFNCPNFNQWVNEILDLASHYRNHQAVITEIEFEIAFEPSLEKISVYIPKQLEIVLVNLIDNAIDSVVAQEEKSLPGYVPTIKIATTYLTKSQQIAIKVVDNGTGIESEMRSEIFEAFQTTKALQIGLGLYVSKTIIQACQGVITLDDSSEKGASFTVIIPVRQSSKLAHS